MAVDDKLNNIFFFIFVDLKKWFKIACGIFVDHIVYYKLDRKKNNLIISIVSSK